MYKYLQVTSFVEIQLMWDHLSLNSGQGIRFGLFTMLPCCKLPCTFHVIVYIFSLITFTLKV